MKKIVILLVFVMLLTSAVVFAGGEKEAAGQSAEDEMLIGFTNWTLGDSFTVALQEGIIEAGEKAGAKVLAYNNEGGKEVDNTRTMISQGVEGAIMCYWDPNLAKTSIDMLLGENIPIMTVDIPMPNTVFLGVENYTVGKVGGDYLGQWIVDNWDGEVDLFVVINSPTEGEFVAERFHGQEDAILEYIDYPEDEIEYADGGGWADGALEATRPILAKHSDAEKIVFVVENDPCVMGIIAALEEAGKADNAIMVTQGTQEETRHLIRSGEGPVIGGVAYFPEKYGNQGVPKLIEMVELVRQGKSVEEAYKAVAKDKVSYPFEGKTINGQAIYVDVKLLTKDNIDEYYPEE